jgi:hypothetical protein
MLELVQAGEATLNLVIELAEHGCCDIEWSFIDVGVRY